MFERFTESARRAVVLGQEEARELEHNYIGTEHLILGVLREERGAGARALLGADVDLERLRAEIVSMIGAGKADASGHLPFTPRCKKTLELALREALRLGHDWVGTGHLLLGLIGEGEGVAAQALARLDVDLEAVASNVLDDIEDPHEPDARRRRRPPSESAILERLARIEERLSEIERHLGIEENGSAEA